MCEPTGMTMCGFEVLTCEHIPIGAFFWPVVEGDDN